jgi:hypothetical protein
MSKFTSDAQLDDWFGYHPPSSDEIRDAHEQVRAKCRELAGFLSDLLPECPDKTVALRAVRAVMYEANACIAVQQKLHVPDQEADDRVFRIRHFQREDGEVVAEIILTADSGKLLVSVGEPKPAPEDTITLYGQDIPHPTAIALDLQGVDSLIRGLPKLRAWVASGEPARVDEQP